MKLYSFPTSSAAYRVRIALHLKNVPFETVTVDLGKGEHHQPTYRGVNPQGRVPALELDDGAVLTQSLAIIDYLEDMHPEPPLYPDDPEARARTLAVALTVAADIHPLNNTSTLAYLSGELGIGEEARDRWYAYWVRAGFAAIEQLIDGTAYCFGREPTVADLCLVPQVFNARRYHVDISDFPKLVAVDAHARANPAFSAARPENQPGFAGAA